MPKALSTAIIGSLGKARNISANTFIQSELKSFEHAGVTAIRYSACVEYSGSNSGKLNAAASAPKKFLSRGPQTAKAKATWEYRPLAKHRRRQRYSKADL